LELFVEIGFIEMQVLQVATIEAAKAIQLNEIGFTEIMEENQFIAV